jgi:preprotein translocase subunit YajC
VIILALIQSQPQANPAMGLITMVAIFAIFYVLLILPMQRQKKQQKKMLASLENGSLIQTTGGIIGTIVSQNTDDDTLVIRVKPDNVKVQIARSAVAGVISEK